MAWPIRVWLRAVDADAEYEMLAQGLPAAVDEAIHRALAKLPEGAIPVEVQVRCLSEPRANGMFRAGHCRDGCHAYCGGEEQDRGDGSQKTCQCHCHEKRTEG